MGESKTRSIINLGPKRKYYNRPGDHPNEGGDAILPRVGRSAAVSVAGVRAGDVVVQRVGPRSVQPWPNSIVQADPTQRRRGAGHSARTRSYKRDYEPLLNINRGCETLLRRGGTYVYTKEGTRVPSLNTWGGFIKDEYCSWVQYKSGPGGGPSM